MVPVTTAHQFISFIFMKVMSNNKQNFNNKQKSNLLILQTLFVTCFTPKLKSQNIIKMFWLENPPNLYMKSTSVLLPKKFFLG